MNLVFNYSTEYFPFSSLWDVPAPEDTLIHHSFRQFESAGGVLLGRSYSSKWTRIPKGNKKTYKYKHLL